MYKIAILGCENSHANAFLDFLIKEKKYEDIEVAGVYSDEPEAMAKLKEAYGVEPVNMPLAGGSLPNYVFTDVLQMPTISVPYGNPDENNHAPNENFKLSCYFSGIHASAQVLYELGTLNVEN